MGRGFIKNKPKVLFDKMTGLLWNNLNSFPYKPVDSENYTKDSSQAVCTSLNKEGVNGFYSWKIPEADRFKKFAVNDNPFWNLLSKLNFRLSSNISGYYVDGYNNVIVDANGCWIKSGPSIFFNYFATKSSADNPVLFYCLADKNRYDYKGCLICYSGTLIKNCDYSDIYSSDILSADEKAKLTLDLFRKHNLIPVFTDKTKTVLYEDIYVKYDELQAELAEVNKELAAAKEQLDTPELTLDFDYLPLLEKYDVDAIQKSVIKYYQAVQQWTGEMLDQLDDYERKNSAMIGELNSISVKLSQKYVANDNLTAEENQLLEKRQAFFRKKIALGMAGVKRKILSVKQQADALEDRLDEIDDGDDALNQLGIVEREKRVTFPFLAENTAKIIRNALISMEYFRTHRNFIKEAVAAWDSWTDDYVHFKTAGFIQLRSSCQADGIEDEVWQSWCGDWQKIRFQVEKKLQPLIERGLEGEIPTVKETEVPVISQLINILAAYKEDVDKVFLEDRKSVYQSFVFQAGGELQDKFETEQRMYRCTTKLQDSLKAVIFNCEEAEDRIFILNWAGDLLNIQINGLLEYIADKRLDNISDSILSGFAQLKMQNLDVYLNDAKAYGQEKERREKEFNSLMFKMRKEVMKNGNAGSNK